MNGPRSPIPARRVVRHPMGYTIYQWDGSRDGIRFLLTDNGHNTEQGKRFCAFHTAHSGHLSWGFGWKARMAVADLIGQIQPKAAS